MTGFGAEDHPRPPLDGEDADTVAAWALDALEDAERDAVDERVRTDPRWAAEAAHWHDVLAARMAAEPRLEPPAALRERLLDQVRTHPQDAGVHPYDALPSRDAGAHRHAGTSGTAGTAGADVVDLAARRRRRRGWAGAVAAAAALAVALPLGFDALSGPSLQERQTAAVQRVLDEGGRQSEAALADGGRLTVALDPSRRAVVTAADLPALAEDRGYQLWIVDAEGAPTSPGMLEVEDGRALVEVGPVPRGAVLAVTVEPAAGSTAPTTEPLGAVPADD